MTRQLTRREIAQVVKAATAGLEQQVAAIEKRLDEREAAAVRKRQGTNVSPQLARLYLAIDEKVAKLERQRGITPRSLAETHPEVHAELVKRAAGPTTAAKTNGLAGAARPSPRGIL